ncbi:MAG TPA: hypothetical protein VKY85_23120 [Candidatus Angelobacter sp.]|nr:hypothetical protein [Candidatus Angelobacter sp.]
MKRLFAFVMTMLLGATLAFGQATGGSTDKADTTSGKKATKTKKGHKGGKKSKKGASDTSTTPPPK